jgi:glycosyltransferase involved in cell wall biosynthesis
MGTDSELTVLQVVANLDVGGAQEVVRTLARFLPDYGCRPVVVTLRDGALRGPIEELGVPVEVLPGRRHSLVASPRAVPELARLHRGLARLAHRHGASVVQTHLLRTLDFVVAPLRWRTDVRDVFWTVHNARLDLRADQLPGQPWLLGAKVRAHRLLYRAGGRVASGFIAVSEDAARAVRSQIHPPEERLFTIPNGVDTGRYGIPVDGAEVRARMAIPADGPLVTVVAKLMEQKGHRVLLGALPRVLERHPDLQVALAGEGPLRDEIAGQAAALGAMVHLVGNRSDVADLLAASDLFVLPSLWEGLPMALLEAMASGLPVIATAVSGSRDVVVPDESGLLVAAGDVGELADAMDALLSDRDRALRLGGAARQRVEEQFSARTQARRHAALFHHDPALAGREVA